MFVLLVFFKFSFLFAAISSCLVALVDLYVTHGVSLGGHTLCCYFVTTQNIAIFTYSGVFD